MSKTVEGFGAIGHVVLFDDFPTAATVAARIQSQTALRLGVVDVILDEVAFCMKTATRLGRVVRLGERWWGRPHTYGAWQMAAVDEWERTGEVPPDFDLWAILDAGDLIELVSVRTGIVPLVVDAVVTEFCEQIESLASKGAHFLTPTRQLGTVDEVRREVAAHIDVFRPYGLDLRVVAIDALLPGGERADVVCEDETATPVLVEVLPSPQASIENTRLSRWLDAIGTSSPVRGLVLSDGTSQTVAEHLMADERVMNLSLRSLDLPRCRAQRWQILEGGRERGWVSVAADGRTVVGGGGPAFPDVAFVGPFGQIDLDWETQRLSPVLVAPQGVAS